MTRPSMSGDAARRMGRSARGDSALAWLATGLLLLTLPFVAHAQLDSEPGGSGPGSGAPEAGSPTEDSGAPFAEGAGGDGGQLEPDGDPSAGSVDASAFLDAGVGVPLTDTESRPSTSEPQTPPWLLADADGCSCRAGGAGGRGLDAAAGLSTIALGLTALVTWSRRRRG